MAFEHKVKQPAGGIATGDRPDPVINSGGGDRGDGQEAHHAAGALTFAAAWTPAVAASAEEAMPARGDHGARAVQSDSTSLGVGTGGIGGGGSADIIQDNDTTIDRGDNTDTGGDGCGTFTGHAQVGNGCEMADDDDAIELIQDSNTTTLEEVGNESECGGATATDREAHNRQAGDNHALLDGNGANVIVTAGDVETISGDATGGMASVGGGAIAANVTARNALNVAFVTGRGDIQIVQVNLDDVAQRGDSAEGDDSASTGCAGGDAYSDNVVVVDGTVTAISGNATGGAGGAAVSAAGTAVSVNISAQGDLDLEFVDPSGDTQFIQTNIRELIQGDNVADADFTEGAGSGPEHGVPGSRTVTPAGAQIPPSVPIWERNRETEPRRAQQPTPVPQAEPAGAGWHPRLIRNTDPGRRRGGPVAILSSDARVSERSG